MINIRNLMVGDWVKTNPSCGKLSCGVKPNITMISEIGFSYSDGMYVHPAGIKGRYYDDELEPILLTKEIMEKNGFNLYPEETNVFYLNAGYRHDLDTVCLYIGDIERPSIYGNDSLGEKTYVVLHCKYVHEFQHILKMCGIEKEIVL